MASALSTFNDFVNVTGPAFLTSAEDVVNEAVKNNYILRRFIRGKNPSDIIQGGSTIRDTLMFDEQSTFGFYEPNETFTWENPQVLTNWEVNWRFAVDHMSWTDQEIELNLGGGLSRAARHHMYKRLKRSKEQRLWTSLLNGVEDQLFAVPETANMEAATGKQPYSIPAFINENTDGLFYKGALPSNKTAWTTIEGIDPTVETLWKPQQVTYANLAVNDESNLVAGFDQMFLDVRFIPPPTHQEYFENASLNAQFIACSKLGQRTYVQMLRKSQDLFVTTSRQDPHYAKPQYAGIDLEYLSNLDTFLLYQQDTGTNPYVSEDTSAAAGAADTGPRYYWINGNYIHPVFHTSRYMYKHETLRHPNQPFTTIVPVDCWYNLVCRSRQRQGILRPDGEVT